MAGSRPQDFADYCDSIADALQPELEEAERAKQRAEEHRALLLAKVESYRRAAEDARRGTVVNLVDILAGTPRARLTETDLNSLPPLQSGTAVLRFDAGLIFCASGARVPLLGTRRHVLRLLLEAGLAGMREATLAESARVSKEDVRYHVRVMRRRLDMEIAGGKGDPYVLVVEDAHAHSRETNVHAHAVRKQAPRTTAPKETRAAQPRRPR